MHLLDSIHTQEQPVSDVAAQIARLQKAKNYRALGQLGGLEIVHGHCGWGWRGLDDVGTADDLPYEAEAWEAGCFESGLMTPVEDMPTTLPPAMLAHLGLLT